MFDIVIVNWNSGRQLADAVDSIVKYHRGLVAGVTVVDNNSSDDSLLQIQTAREEAPFPVRVIPNKENAGFGVACNQGAVGGSAPLILFLNPDARLHPESLQHPSNYMSSPGNGDVGICGVQLLDEFGHVARSCSRFPTVTSFMADALGLTRLPHLRSLKNAMAEWPHDTTRPVDQVIGAFFVIRREVFDRLGGFDPRFFVYFEEVDLSLRARNAGWKSVFLADVQAFHAGGGSSNQVKATRLFYSLRSRLLYGFKHFALVRAWALFLVTLLIEPVTRSLFFLAKGNLAGVSETLRGYAALYRAIPEILGASRA